MRKTLHQNYFTIAIKISETENAAPYFFNNTVFFSNLKSQTSATQKFF